MYVDCGQCTVFLVNVPVRLRVFDSLSLCVCVCVCVCVSVPQCFDFNEYFFSILLGFLTKVI